MQRKRRIPSHDAGSSSPAAGGEGSDAEIKGGKKRRGSERGAAAAAAAAAAASVAPSMAAAPSAPVSSSSSSSIGGKGSDDKDDGGAGSKGLRHFSMKVCRKVEEKGQTTYNEVADELVAEFLALGAQEASAAQAAGGGGASNGSKGGGGQFDEKNIRRRVYDALNVLMAMDIIAKDKKDILWKGLPTNAQHDKDSLERERGRLLRSVAAKKAHLALLMEQRVTYANLVKVPTPRSPSMPPPPPAPNGKV
jgi:hypothetical protein